MTEINNWKLAYGKAMNEKASSDMEKTFVFIEDLQKRLSRPCQDLDDIRAHMKSLNEIKEQEILIDRTIAPVEETYAMLNKYEIVFNDGNPEKVDSLSYGWKKLNAKVRNLMNRIIILFIKSFVFTIKQALEVQDHLLNVQPNFKNDLLDKVTIFKKDSAHYVDDYNTK